MVSPIYPFGKNFIAQKMIKIGLFILSVIFFVLLFVGGPDYYSTRSFKAAWDLGHVLVFFLLTYLALELKTFKKLNVISQIGIVLGFTIFMGLGIEWIQSFIGRDPEIADLRRNLEGSVLAIVLLIPYQIKFFNLKRVLLFIISLLIIIETIPLAKAFNDEWQTRDQFPVLSNLENWFDDERWESTASHLRAQDVASQGDYSLKAELTTQKYSGVYLKYFINDWSDFTTLKFSIYNPQNDPFELHCRLHDENHIKYGQAYDDRYNTILKIEPDWNHFEIPLNEIKEAPESRMIDLRQIKSLAFFVMRLKANRYIYIDNVYLN